MTYSNLVAGSALCYSLTTLRDIVNDHEKTINPNSKKPTVAFDSPELIYTQHMDVESPYKGTHLKYPVNAKDILKFIRSNRRYLTDKSGTVEFNPKVQ